MPNPFAQRSYHGTPTRRTLLVGAAASLVACTVDPDRDHRDADAPRAQALKRPIGVAWVFSSGGPRGFVHVGAIKALRELGLAPDLIVGASVGALVGGLHASGLTAAELESLALDLQPAGLARWAVGAQEKLSGSAITDLVRRHAHGSDLSKLAVPMACVATRKRDALTVAFTAGDLGLAVQASAAIEGQFAPVRIHGEQFVDADWYTPLPVRLARSLGAQRVLALDASAHVDRAPPDAQAYRANDLRKKALVDADSQHADLVIKPDFGYWAGMSRAYRERVIQAGYRDTLAQAAALRQLHTT